jgi:hypothetical protein
MESAIESNIALGKVLIVAKMKLPSIQPKPVDSFKKKAILLQFPQNKESIITLKR